LPFELTRRDISPNKVGALSTTTDFPSANHGLGQPRRSQRMP
jgi:hypothetical protein